MPHRFVRSMHPFRSLRPARALGAAIALFSMLFMQLALAGYGCSIGSMPGSMTPSVASGMSIAIQQLRTPVTLVDDQAMPGCEGMQTAMLPGLCHASVHPQDQSLDSHATPALPDFIVSSLRVIDRLTTDTGPASSLQPDAAFLARAASPPLSIRHCCFRI